MKNGYYDIWKFKDAYSCISTDPMKAKEKYENYLKDYPDDYCAYVYLVYVLILLDELDNAENILNEVQFLATHNDLFLSQFNKVKLFQEDMIFTKLRLLSRQGKYEECYDLYLQNSKILGGDEKIKQILYYWEKELGVGDVDDLRFDSYIFRQINNYKESDFMNHIKKHMSDYNVSVNEPNEAIFYPDFPFNEVVGEIRKYIPSKKRLCTGFFEDKYVFKFDRCGRNKHKITDYFRVSCFKDTNKLITMFPALYCEQLLYVDLNYLNRNDEKPKVKQLSQIEKFNKRYGRN